MSRKSAILALQRKDVQCEEGGLACSMADAHGSLRIKLSTISNLGVTAVSAAAGELGLPSLTDDTLIQKCVKAGARRLSSTWAHAH